MELSYNKITIFLILLVLLLVLAFSFQGIRGVWDPDEGYYIGTAISMEAQKNYLVPILGEEEIFLDKPPVLYWGILGGFKLFGHSESAARFFTGLCFGLTAMVVLALEFSMSGRLDKAFWAAVMYATMIIPFIAADFVTPDTPLTLFTTLSMLCFWQSIRPNGTKTGLWIVLLAIAVGLGFLTKGPAALIPCGAMFVYLLIQKQMKRFFLNPWIVAAAMMFAAVGLSWYIYISWKLPDAGAYFFDNMIWGRLVSGKYQRNPGAVGALIYLPVILLGTMPWSVLWYGNNRGLRAFLHGRTWKEVFANPSKTLLACWILIPLIVLCAASSKLGFYALPIFPALALATVRLFSCPENRESTIATLQPPKSPFVLTWVVALLLARLILGAIPSSHDCRTLWHELKPYLPDGQYEIVTVDERASGLWFYGAREVENITRRPTPYPTFIPTENLENEIGDMAQDDYPHLFLIQGKKHLPSIKNVLSETGWDIKEISLKYNRWLLICEPQ
ncbi:MAG: glycosyltransferase family 39 protein [Phycisphaerae bacterium]|nr:glycosyltransferase family 39 protein [Phycisphaerae bacterium]